MEQRRHLNHRKFLPNFQRARTLLGIPGYLAWLLQPCKGGRCLSSTKCSVNAMLTNNLFLLLQILADPTFIPLLIPHLSSAYAWLLMLLCLTFDLWSCSKLLSHSLFLSHPPPSSRKALLAFSWSLLIPFQVTSHLTAFVRPACLCSDTHSDSFSLGQAWVAEWEGPLEETKCQTLRME